MVQSVPYGDQVPAALTETILVKAEGNPFFLEELTRAVVERGELYATSMVPDTIQGVLLARIDRLPGELRRALQLAAVLRRAISPKLWRLIWDGPGDADRYLQELKHQEFLYEHTEAGGESVYLFKHVLIQEVAYETLSPARRQTLHAAVGRALESLYAESRDRVYDRCG